MSNPLQPGRLSSLRVFFLVALLLAVVVGGIVGGIAYTGLGDDDGEHQTLTPKGLNTQDAFQLTPTPNGSGIVGSDGGNGNNDGANNENDRADLPEPTEPPTPEPTDSLIADLFYPTRKRASPSGSTSNPNPARSGTCNTPPLICGWPTNSWGQSGSRTALGNTS